MKLPALSPSASRPALPPQLATSAGLFYGYVFVIGLILFFVVKWFKGELKLVNVFCIYGQCAGRCAPLSDSRPRHALAARRS